MNLPPKYVFSSEGALRGAVGHLAGAGSPISIQASRRIDRPRRIAKEVG